MYFSKVVSSVSLCHKIGTSKVRGPSNCYFAVYNTRAFQLALGIAAGVQRISCGRSLRNIKGPMGCPTSCSEIFLTGHGRKLCLKPNWNVANSILGCRRAFSRGDTRWLTLGCGDWAWD